MKKVMLVGILALAFGDRVQAQEEKTLAELAKARKEIARKMFDKTQEAEGASPSPGYVWSKRLLDAELDLSETPKARSAAYRQHLSRMQDVAARAKANSPLSPFPTMEAEFYVLEARSWWLKAQRE